MRLRIVGKAYRVFRIIQHAAHPERKGGRMPAIVIGEFQSRVRAKAAREALAGFLRAHYDVASDTYTATVDGDIGRLRIRDARRNECDLVIEITQKAT